MIWMLMNSLCPEKSTLTNVYDDYISVFNSHGHMEPHIVAPILFWNISLSIDVAQLLIYQF